MPTRTLRANEKLAAAGYIKLPIRSCGQCGHFDIKLYPPEMPRFKVNWCLLHNAQIRICGFCNKFKATYE